MRPDDTDADALTTVVSAGTPFEAHTIASVLAAADIEAVVFDTAEFGLGLPLGIGRRGVPVQVRRRDVERARETLRRNVSDSVDIDWTEVDVGRGQPDGHAALARRRRGMPPLARVGFALAAALAVIGVAAAALMWIV